MTTPSIKEELQRDFDNKFGHIEHPYDSEHPYVYIRWAARWAMEQCANLIDTQEHSGSYDESGKWEGYFAKQIRQLASELGGINE